MRARVLVVALVLAIGVTACGSDRPTVMPDVTGQKLDRARAAIKDAGFADEVKVDGGGALGVIVESNWEVCGQSPSAGEKVSEAPRLAVDRSCDRDAESSETAKPSEAAEAGAADQVLTKANSEDLAALLGVSDYCDPSVKRFAAEHGGSTIKFDGSIADIANHGEYRTRYDILVAPGAKGPQSTAGPAFKFEDVNVLDLNLTGANVPESIDEGDRFRFAAEVIEYDPSSCLLFLAPVSTRVG